jgi:hypothetical protein
MVRLTFKAFTFNDLLAVKPAHSKEVRNLLGLFRFSPATYSH